MFTWLAAMCHPDGNIAFFNDSAFGIALTPAQLGACARTLGLRINAPPDDEILRLEPSGYVRIRRDRLQILFRCGTRRCGLHSGACACRHAVVRGFPGTRAFSPIRASRHTTWAAAGLATSTGAHNTVEIDGEDSSEMWSTFRVARRPVPSIWR